MKKTILSAAAVLAIAGITCFWTSARAQNERAGAAAKTLPTKIALVDMAEVFKEYKKFEALREGLKADIEATDAKAKAMAAQAQKLQQELQSGTFNDGTPEYKQRESQLIQLKNEFETFKAQSQRDFMRKESQIYKTVYLEVSDMVKKFAVHYEYTLVLRFNRASLEEADDPQGVLASMNKQVLYSQAEDDLTDSLIEYLNKLYSNQAGGNNSKNPAATRRN